MLSNKNIIVIGGSGLIGRGVVTSCEKNGATVIIAGRDSKSAGFKRLCDETSVDFPFLEVSTSNPQSVGELFERAEPLVGKISAVVNCEFPRNINFGCKFEDVNFEDFCDNVNSQLGSGFLVCQKAIEYFSTAEAGNIVNFSSIYGYLAPRFELYEDTNLTKEIEYAACKAAIIQMTRYLARYVKGRNIRINCVSPGGVRNNQPASFVKRYNKFCINKGMLDPMDIAGTVVFLLSDSSRYINGQNIVVDDGFSL